MTDEEEAAHPFRVFAHGCLAAALLIGWTVGMVALLDFLNP